MPSQTPMTDSNCDLGNAMIKTKTLRYNHKSPKLQNEFRAFMVIYLKYYSKYKGRNIIGFQQVYPIEKL